jgi:hypothetical protein
MAALPTIEHDTANPCTIKYTPNNVRQGVRFWVKPTMEVMVLFYH